MVLDFSKLNLSGAEPEERQTKEDDETPFEEPLEEFEEASKDGRGTEEGGFRFFLPGGRPLKNHIPGPKEEVEPATREKTSSEPDTFPEADLKLGLSTEVDKPTKKDPINPLLEADYEDEEEVWGGVEEPLRRTEFVQSITGELTERDDLTEADLETFQGFDGSEEKIEAEEPGEQGAINPLLEEDEDEEDLFLRVRADAQPRRFFPKGLDPEFDRRLEEAPARKETVAAKREANLRKKKKEEAEQKEYKADFQKKPVETVTVNEAGETRTERGKERKRLTREPPSGKLKDREIEFFSNFGKRKNAYLEGMKTTELLSGPLNQFATAKEKRERLDRLERVFDSRVSYRSGADFILNEKMIDTLSFLALFRYAKHTHLATLFGEAARTSKDRLYRLQANGLVDSRKIYAGTSIWFLTEAGLLVSGYDVRKITDSRLTYSMFPHQFTVNHVAAGLWGGTLNVLYLPDFPSKNRTNLKDQPVLGERLTSELEILSSFAKMKLFEDSSSFRPKLMGLMDSEFKKWADSDRTTTPSPEMIYGNEWMYTLFPPLPVGIAYHVPDLVVRRHRASNGAPRSLAVEIEISNKNEKSYRKTLQAYAADKRIFAQVIWVCKTMGTAKKLERVGRDLGLIQNNKLKIVPILTADGVFKGRDLWTI